MWRLTYAGVVFRHKVRQSYICRTVWPRITNFKTNLHTGRVYSNTSDIYVRSAVIDVQNMAEHDASDGFNVESPKLANTSIPTSWTAIPDMTSLTSLDQKLSWINRQKCRLICLQVEFFQKGLSEDHQISHGCRDQLVLQICRIWRHYLLLVGCKIQLNTAQKCCAKRVWLVTESNNSETV